jgi:hypothetical protein
LRFDCAEYLNERLTKLLDESISTENWLDVATGWETILSLRAEMTAERGQAILDCASAALNPLQLRCAVDSLQPWSSPAVLVDCCGWLN